MIQRLSRIKNKNKNVLKPKFQFKITNIFSALLILFAISILFGFSLSGLAQDEGNLTTKFQVINATSDLRIIDPFLDSYSIGYELYNPTNKFISVNPTIDQVSDKKSRDQITILPPGTSKIYITNLSPIETPKWLQTLINPRLDRSKTTINQNLTNGKIFGEQVWTLNNNQSQLTQVKVFFTPWKTVLVIIILITILISFYYFTLWLLAKIKINGHELISTPHISKRLPVIICFGVSFICLTILLITQMLIPRVDLSGVKTTAQKITKNVTLGF